MLKNAIKSLAVLLCAVSLTACNEEAILDFRNAEVSHGTVYQEGANKPFTGKLTNFPYVSIQSQKIYAFTDTINNVIKNYPEAQKSDGGTAGQIICDAHVVEGVLDGAVVCKVSTTGYLAFKLNMNKGTPDGLLEVYTYSLRDAKVGVANFSNGELNGESTIFNPATGEALYTATWINSKLEVAQSAVATASVVANQTADNTACVDLWTAVHRKEVGAEEIITMAQIEEWESWCKVGKVPLAI